MLWLQIWLRFTVFFSFSGTPLFNPMQAVDSTGFLVTVLFLNPISYTLQVVSILTLFVLSIILLKKSIDDFNPKFLSTILFAILLKFIMLSINLSGAGQYMYANAIFMGIILIYLLITHLWLFPRWKRKGLI